MIAMPLNTSVGQMVGDVVLESFGFESVLIRQVVFGPLDVDRKDAEDPVANHAGPNSGKVIVSEAPEPAAGVVEGASSQS